MAWANEIVNHLVILRPLPCASELLHVLKYQNTRTLSYSWTSMFSRTESGNFLPLNFYRISLPSHVVRLESFFLKKLQAVYLGVIFLFALRSIFLLHFWKWTEFLLVLELLSNECFYGIVMFLEIRLALEPTFGDTVIYITSFSMLGMQLRKIDARFHSPS